MRSYSPIAAHDDAVIPSFDHDSDNELQTGWAQHTPEEHPAKRIKLEHSVTEDLHERWHPNSDSPITPLPFSPPPAYSSAREYHTIMREWSHNQMLQDWFCGNLMQVNDSNGNIVLRSISFHELILFFQASMANQYTSIVSELWNKHLAIRHYMCGPDIPFLTLTWNFKSLLASGCNQAIFDMWNKNPLLQNWLFGHPIFIENSAEPNEFIITSEELIDYFQSILASQSGNMIDTIWENNTALHNAVLTLDATASIYLLHKVLNACNVCRKKFILTYLNHINNPQIVYATLEQIKSNTQHLKAAHQKTSMLTHYLKEKKYDQAISNKEPLRRNIFGQNKFERPLALNSHFEVFEEILFYKNKIDIYTAWDKDNDLRNWLLGKPYFNLSPTYGPQSRTISLNELKHYFNIFLTQGLTTIVLKIWQNNPILQNWVLGNPSHQEGIGLDELSGLFISLLASKNREIANTIWDHSSLLQQWFRVQQPPDQNILHFPKYNRENEILFNFQSALSSKNSYIIDEFCKNNDLIRKVLNNLPPEKTIYILIKIIISDQYGKSLFITDYINQFDNLELLQKALKAIKENTKSSNISRYKNKQITILQNRIDTIISNSSKLNDNMSMQSLFSQLPILSKPDNAFVINKSLGLQLKTLPTEVRHNLGIESIRKITHQDAYLVHVSREQYQQSHTQYTHTAAGIQTENLNTTNTSVASDDLDDFLVSAVEGSETDEIFRYDSPLLRASLFQSPTERQPITEAKMDPMTYGSLEMK